MPLADGSRMTPTHPTKKAKRYRYYVSASLLAGDHPQAQKGMRVPAADIEALVLDRLRAFFSSRTDVGDALTPHDLEVRAFDAALRNAFTLSKRWLAMPPVEMKSLVLDIVERVTIAANRIDIWLNRAKIATALEAEEGAKDLISTPSPCRSKRSCDAPARGSASLDAPLRKALKLSERWLAMPPVELKSLVQEIVDRITVAADRIEIQLSRAKIAAALQVGERGQRPDLDPVALSIEAKVRRAGKGKRLVIGNGAETEERRPRRTDQRSFHDPKPVPLRIARQHRDNERTPRNE